MTAADADLKDVERSAETATTDDLFLGETLRVRQPRAGYRAGTDAVLLAAAVRPADARFGPILDVGAGVGVVGLCVAARCPDAHVTLLEREPFFLALARDNVIRNGVNGRVCVVEADIVRASEGLERAGVRSESFAIVLANPPYHQDRRSTASGVRLKANAHQMPDNGLEAWARFMCRMAAPAGRAVMIHNAEALPHILAAFDGRFGALSVLPIYARSGEPAIRVIVDGIKGSRAPLCVRPGLILHGRGQDFRPEIEAVFRHGAALPLRGGG